MEKTGKHKKRFGLIGKDISYSFSKTYFNQKFEQLGLGNYSYENFDIPEIDRIQQILNYKDVKGLNVTIPYKEAVLPYLDTIDETAAKIGAVNTIKFGVKGTQGFNTDAHGFKSSLLERLKPQHKNALILGTGGASKAIAYALKELAIEFKFVSRKPNKEQFNYVQLDNEAMIKYQLIVNCTPLGTHPNTDERPPIPYEFLTADHYLFDLIYNPSESTFLRLGKARGATVQNGLKMLELQAEKSWEIWNS